MTPLGILLAARRRWYVCLVGLLLSALGAQSATHAEGTYQSSASMLFLAPISRENPNAYLALGGNLINAAGVLQTRVNSPQWRDRMRARGLTADYSVVLFNKGNQWANDFDRPLLDLGVTGPDAESVDRSMRLLVEGMNAELVRWQRDAEAARVNWIRTQLTPADPAVLLGTGSPLRAGAASLLLGGTLTLIVAVLLDDLLARRRRRHIPRPPAPTEPRVRVGV